MKHILLDNNGAVFATILCCPFKYTLPRGCSVYEDNPVMGQIKVDTFCHTQPKNQDDVNVDAIDFAVVRDGAIENVVVWGGGEWLPPYGTMLVPLEKWIGRNDIYDQDLDKFSIHEDRLGVADKDKTVEELQSDYEASQPVKE